METVRPWCEVCGDAAGAQLAVLQARVARLEKERDGWRAMAVVASESNGILADALDQAGIPDPRIKLGEEFMAALAPTEAAP